MSLPPEVIDEIITRLLSGLTREDHTERHHLYQLCKVCKSWNAVATRRLYSSVTISLPVAEWFDDEAQRRSRLFRYTVMFKPVPRDMIKTLELTNYGEYEQCYFFEEDYVSLGSELLTLCSSVTHLTLRGLIPHPAHNTRNALGGRKFKELKLYLSMNKRGKPLFRSALEMVLFILTLPDIETVVFGSEDLCLDLSADARRIRDEEEEEEEEEEGDDRADTDETTTGSSSEVKVEDEDKTPQKRIRVLKPYSTLPMVNFDVYTAGELDEDCLRQLSKVHLPYLKMFKINYRGLGQSDYYLLKCLANLPDGLEVLQLRRTIEKGSSVPSGYVKALDRFHSLKDLSISENTGVNLEYIFGRSTLLEFSYENRIFDEQGLEFLIEKFQRVSTESSSTQTQTYAYLPLLTRMDIYLEQRLRTKKNEIFLRLALICFARGIKLVPTCYIEKRNRWDTRMYTNESDLNEEGKD